MLGYHRPSKGIRLSGSHTEAQHSPVPSATAERQTKGCGTAKKWAECEIKGRWGCKGVVKVLGAFMESGQSSRHPPGGESAGPSCAWLMGRLPACILRCSFSVRDMQGSLTRSPQQLWDWNQGARTPPAFQQVLTKTVNTPAVRPP